MDSPKQLFQKSVFSIPQHLLELQNANNRSENKIVQKPKTFMKTFTTKLGARNYSTLLTTWFDFAYFCCISPFHFTKKAFPKNGFDIVRNKFQNVICAIGHLSTLLMYFGEVRNVSPEGINPVSYLDFFMVHMTFTRHFFLVLILWRKSSLFQEIVNILDTRRPLIHKYCSRMEGGINKNKGVIPKKWNAILIVSVYSFFAIYIMIIQPLMFMSQSEGNRLKEFQNSEESIKFNYFIPSGGGESGVKNPNAKSESHTRPFVMSFPPDDGQFSNESTNSGDEINTDENPIFETRSLKKRPKMSRMHGNDSSSKDDPPYSPTYPWVIVGFVGVIMRYLFGCYADCLILLIVLSLWFPVADFAKLIQMMGTENGRVSTLDSLTEYRDLKKLSTLINASMKHLLIFVVLQAIFFYPVGLKQVVASCEFTGVHYIAFFLISFCLTFYFAADICKQMQSFQAYLRDVGRNRWELSKLDLYMVLQEATTNPVGIADEGRFVIDYPFVATIMGTLMTYFVITIQHDQCPEERDKQIDG